MLHLSGYSARALGLNYPEIPDSCGFVEFSRVENVVQVLVYSSDVYIEELRHEFLGEPDGSFFVAHFNPSGFVSSEHEELAGGVFDELFTHDSPRVILNLRRPAPCLWRRAPGFAQTRAQEAKRRGVELAG